MIRGETSTGFAFTLDKNVMNNMELIDVLADSSLDAGFRASAVVKMVLGDQRKKLYDHVRTDDGRVPVEAIDAEMKEIFASINESQKNS